MPRMIDLVKQSAVPASVMRSAAHGGLSLPAAEMIEILVHLTHSHVFGAQAKLTLAAWDESVLAGIARDPNGPGAVLEYLSDPENARAGVVRALVENRSIADERIAELASVHSHDILAALADSPRVRNSAQLRNVLAANPYLESALRQRLGTVAESDSEPDAANALHDDACIDQQAAKYVAEHHSEITAESDRAFELVESTAEEQQELKKLSPPAADAQGATKPPVPERISPILKIGRLNVGERVQLALRGSKDERFILIRDGAKVVALAVLDSPKITEQEVEVFASMKNVQEVVLRMIASKRKFMKLYAVIRALVNNPRTPMDVSLPLLKNLLVADLKNLIMNKNVADTVRKLAFKQLKEKSSAKRRD